MNEELRKMYHKKREFIRLLEKTIKTDKARNDVRSIKYSHLEDGPYKEIIVIEYEGGGLNAIKADGNSNGANAKEIIHAIYGGGNVVGLIPHYRKGGVKSDL